MPTHQDETLPQRYAREYQDYLKLCGSMTAEQVADLQSQLNNALAREQALQHRLTAADEREDALSSLVPEAEMALKALNIAVSVFDVELADSARRGLRLIIAALKPAEGGGDEAMSFAQIAQFNDDNDHCPEREE